MKKAWLLTIIVSCVTISVLLESCANMARPTGGPRDSLPPMLLKATPKDSTLNAPLVKTVLTFDFDEFIELDNNISANLIISPTLPGVPNVSRKLRTVTVRIKDTLDKNTTYSFNFGKAIKDLNEGNIYNDFTYTFSTGPYLDSLTLSGQIILAETGKTDSTLTVMLHTNMDDSAVVKDRPRYYTRLDNKGQFLFKNLPPGNFKIYALKDEGGARRYMSPDQLFAFGDSLVTPGQTTAPITLYAYVEEKDKEEKEKPASGAKSPGRGGKKEKDEKDKKLKFLTNMDGSSQDLLKDLTLTFPGPLEKYDSTGVILFDSTYKPVTGYTLSLDTSRTIITLKYKWPAATAFNLAFKENSITDSLEAAVPVDTLNFITKKASEYGQLKIRFNKFVAGDTPKVLQLVMNNEVKYSFKIGPNPFFAPLFVPGEYEVRLLNDTNDNGKWDPGTFFTTRRQPEIVTTFEKKLSVRANWENEHVIDL